MRVRHALVGLALATTNALTGASAVRAETLGPNLIQNPSVENESAPGTPSQWLRGGYGTNTRTLTYPVAGASSPRGLQVTISAYTSGDAKWYFADVPVAAGKTYQFSNFYHATIPSIMTAQYRMSDGSLRYADIGTLAPAAAYTAASARFTPPSGASSMTIFHLINQAGELRTDEFALQEVVPDDAPPPPPPPSGGTNLITNPDLETAGSGGNPAGWFRGGYGTNTRAFTYPATGVGGSRAATVTISSYTSGDAKWYFNDVPVSQGTYTYRTAFKSTVTSSLVTRFQDDNGAFTYQDVGFVPPSSSFVSTSAPFYVPVGVRSVTVFHVIKSVGELTIDDTSLVRTSDPQGIFITGAVSLTFDDGWLSQFQDVVPKLNSAGMKATFYIISRRFSDTGFPAYMSRAQVQQLFQQGHEIGAHTRTHRDLATLSSAEQQTEIQGSRQDLLTMNVGPIMTLAYPFGSYNSITLQTARNASYSSGRTTMSGRVRPAIDHFQLPRFPGDSPSTFAQIQQAINQAIAAKEWLILVFHQINTSGQAYTQSPAVINQVVDYLVQQNIPVVTVTQGMQSM